MNPNRSGRIAPSSRSPKKMALGVREESDRREAPFGSTRVIRIQQSVAAGEKKV
jgi:hypothetical protein